MKFATLVLGFNQSKWILSNLENSYEYVDTIYLMYPKKSWFNNLPNDLDINSIKESKYFDKIKIIEGDWEDEISQRNYAFQVAKKDNVDYLMIHDADEFYFKKDFEKILSYVKDNENIDIFRINFYTFWKSFKYIIINNDNRYISGCAQTIFKLNSIDTLDNIRESKNENLKYDIIPGVICYHGSYVLSDEEMYIKINSWGHHKEISSNWYDNVWLKWQLNDENLHPIWDWAWKKVEIFTGKLPEVIPNKYKEIKINYIDYSYDNIHIGQGPSAYNAFSKIVKDFDTIIEIGTHTGGLTKMLYDMKKDSCHLLSYDIDMSNCMIPYKLTLDKHLYLIEEDVLSEDGINDISQMIRRKGRTLVLCDGGNKEREFSIFSKFLKSNDVIMCHDYLDDINTFNKGKLYNNWLGSPESFYVNIEKDVISNRLDKHKYYEEFLECFWGIFVSGPSDDSYPYRTEIINYIIKKFNLRSYLEIGVYNPRENYNLVSAKHKNSVDTCIIYKDEYTHFMTSDEFFEQLYYESKYDIIFIDGLHTYEQSYKDFKNALNSIYENGFILLHDINPKKIYHATKEEKDAYLLDGIWNGEVYKTLMRIKNEYSEKLNIFCLDEPLGGLAIITKRDFGYTTNNSKHELTWEYFEKNRHNILNMISMSTFKNILDNEK